MAVFLEVYLFLWNFLLKSESVCLSSACVLQVVFGVKIQQKIFQDEIKTHLHFSCSFHLVQSGIILSSLEAHFACAPPPDMCLCNVQIAFVIYTGAGAYTICLFAVMP